MPSFIPDHASEFGGSIDLVDNSKRCPNPHCSSRTVNFCDKRAVTRHLSTHPSCSKYADQEPGWKNYTSTLFVPKRHDRDPTSNPTSELADAEQGTTWGVSSRFASLPITGRQTSTSKKRRTCLDPEFEEKFITGANAGVNAPDQELLDIVHQEEMEVFEAEPPSPSPPPNGSTENPIFDHSDRRVKPSFCGLVCTASNKAAYQLVNIVSNGRCWHDWVMAYYETDEKQECMDTRLSCNRNAID
jgi:hypothetical protein